jgi:hypothetical protein
MYVGNGTIAEGAPAIGVTEVLTQYSNFIGSAISYTFRGSDSGVTSQTGPAQAQPVSRILQKVLDESVSIKDFGAVGDGVVDDTAAINRAIVQIYPKNLNGVHRNVQRAIRFPAGTYKITGTLYVPPNVTFIGEGKNNTIILATASTAITTCDSYLQIGFLLGTNGAILPSFITIVDMAFQSPPSVPAVAVTSGSMIIFDRCQFIGGTYGVSISGISQNIKCINCAFTGYAIGKISAIAGSTNIVETGSGLETSVVALPVGTTTVGSLPIGAGIMQYQITDSANNYLIGTLTFTNSPDGCVSFDSNVQPIISMGATVFAANSGVVTCAVTNTSTFKYNLKQFI